MVLTVGIFPLLLSIAACDLALRQINSSVSKEGTTGITVKKENRKVNDSFIARFLKVQEKVSTLHCY